MSLILNQRMFYVNSRNRIHYDTETDSKFTFNIDLNDGQMYDKVCIMQCVIPKSFYSFVLDEINHTAIITIPIGNYSARTFMAVLAGLLTTSSPNGWTYTITYPTVTTQADTGKFTYVVSGNAGVQPKIITTINVYEQLGFNKNTTNTFVGDTITSTNVLKFNLEDTLFIHSSISSNGGDKDSILQEMYLDTSDFSNITYQCINVEAYSKNLSTQHSNVYSFTLTNEDGVEINLNGLNLVFTILVYRKNPVYNDIRNAIRLNILAEK